jgi:hypothetical protein
MTLRHHGQLDPATRRPHPTHEQQQLAELAHRTREPISLLRRLSPDYQAEWLARQRHQDAARARAEITQLRAQLTDITSNGGDGRQ